ncbi:MAG: hypothetical protein MK437_06420 [SAR324 cluster bacterium]|nr:hypothetical protein [SAR324 cluster bacterium]
MCHGEIHFDEFSGNGFDFQDYFKDAREAFEGFEADGLVRLGQDCIKLTDSGRLFMRNLAMPFDRYLQFTSTPRFSRTV